MYTSLHDQRITLLFVEQSTDPPKNGVVYTVYTPKFRLVHGYSPLAKPMKTNMANVPTTSIGFSRVIQSTILKRLKIQNQLPQSTLSTKMPISITAITTDIPKGSEIQRNVEYRLGPCHAIWYTFLPHQMRLTSTMLWMIWLPMSVTIAIPNGVAK